MELYEASCCCFLFSVAPKSLALLKSWLCLIASRRVGRWMGKGATLSWQFLFINISRNERTQRRLVMQFVNIKRSLFYCWLWAVQRATFHSAGSQLKCFENPFNDPSNRFRILCNWIEILFAKNSKAFLKRANWFLNWMVTSRLEFCKVEIFDLK